VIVECPSRVAGMRKQSAGASGGAGGRAGRRSRPRTDIDGSGHAQQCVQD
jgi:hypothetical protein